MNRKNYFQDAGQSVVLYEEVPMVSDGRETLVTRLRLHAKSQGASWDR